MRKLFFLFGLMLSVSLAFAQQTISGRVTGEDGNPLVGATVAAKGANATTTTNANGQFTLSVPAGVKTLVVSYVGMTTLEVAASGNNLSISMKSASGEIGEVVVTGVAQATSKKKLTFAATTVKGSEINIVPQLDASQSLRGRVAGIQISQTQGDRGAAVFLRGAKSVFGNIAPLIVVDGFQTSLTLSDLNPEDIESIEVVKGGAGAALYGTRAEGGVIQVITKKGRANGGKPTIVADAEFGVNNIQRIPDLTDKHIYKVNPDGSFLIANPASPFQRTIDYQANGFSIKMNPYKQTFDNTRALLDNRPFSNYVVSMSDAKGPLKYYVSFQNQRRGGAVSIVDADVRNTMKVNVGYNPSNKIETNVTFQYINFNRPSDYISRNTQGTLFAATLQYEPFMDLTEKNPDGTYKAKPTGFEFQNANLYNPLYEWDQREVSSTSTNTLLGGDIRWRFAKGFDVFASGSMNTETGNNWSYYPIGYQTITATPSLNNGNYAMGTSTNKFLNGNIQLNYAGSKGDFEYGGSVKYIYEEYNGESFSASGYNLTVPLKELAVTDPATRSMNSDWNKTINKGYFVNARLGWKNKLFIDALGRVDQSSRFGADAESAFFPRVSAAYRITEDFKLGPVNELKFRAAFGRAGSVPPYNAKNSQTSVSGTNVSLIQLANPGLSRSYTDEVEIGFDGQAFNRLNFNLTYAFANSQKDFIQTPPIQQVNGTALIWRNLGAVQSRSIEAELNSNIMNTKKVRWNTGLTFTLVRSKITDLGGIPEFTYDGLFRKAEGLSAYAFWGFKVLRSLDELQIDKTTGFVTNVPGNLSPSDFTLNSKGFVVEKSKLGTAAERPVFFQDAATGNTAFLQRGEPDFQIGLPQTFSFFDNKLSLFFLVDWKQGGYKYNSTIQYLTFDNRTKLFEDYTSSGLPLQFIQSIYNGNNITNFWLEKNSFVALRELSLAYNLAGNKLGMVGKVVKNARLALIGRNLFYFTKYTGVNPEGYFEYYPYPVYRTFSAKLTINL
jgi:TonB-linked SusC/RagA family outer membrane protein